MFKILKEDKKSGARVGILKVGNRKVKTPFFMPVATKASAKHINSLDMKSMGADAIICNSFILYLRPGIEIIKKFKGLHGFMNYDGIIFTDSGGFQMLKPSLLQKIEDHGVTFKSPFDGISHTMTPEKAMEVQLSLGSDVAMALDDVRHHTGMHDEMHDAMLRTHYWAKRCKVMHDTLKKKMKSKQLLFAITQGGLYKDLRKESADFINSLDTDGIAIGGLRIGESRKLFLDTIKEHMKDIRKDKPHYLMGVGSPVDIVEAIANGIDCFDSRMPTMCARHGTIFTSKGTLRLMQAVHRKSKLPLDKNCDCFVCKNYSRAYLNFELSQDEAVGLRACSYHNLYFLQKLCEKARVAIQKGKFSEFRKKLLKDYKE